MWVGLAASSKLVEERREEETYDKPSGQLRALTLGIPNKCKAVPLQRYPRHRSPLGAQVLAGNIPLQSMEAPVVTAQRFSQEQGYIDVEWVSC
eukprot:4447741-Amphidinium_carterae.1